MKSPTSKQERERRFSDFCKKRNWNPLSMGVEFDHYKAFLEKEIAKAVADYAQEERQFILNILNGIDIADEQIGNKGGGTKAIRFALQSRVLPSLSTKEPQ